MTINRPVAVVTGGSGFVGNYLLRELLRGGAFAQICALTRNETPVFPDVITAVTADIAGANLPVLQADVLFHIAGEKRDETHMHRTNVEGTQRILEWAAISGISRVVYLSSVGVYGASTHAGVVTEDTPQRPNNLYEFTKSEAEAMVARFCADHAIDYVILQPSNVIGWGARGERPLLSFLRNIAAGRVPLFSGNSAMLNYVEVEDVARAMARFAQRSGNGQRYILNQSAPIPVILGAVQARLGLPDRLRKYPYLLGQVLARAGDRLHALGITRFPFDSARLRELVNTTCYDGGRIERDAGFSYLYSAPDAVVRLAGTYRENGLL